MCLVVALQSNTSDSKKEYRILELDLLLVLHGWKAYRQTKHVYFALETHNEFSTDRILHHGMRDIVQPGFS